MVGLVWGFEVLFDWKRVIALWVKKAVLPAGKVWTVIFY